MSVFSRLRRIEPLNYLLVFLPIALALRFTGADGIWIFLTASLGIIPLAGLMGKSTEMLADQFGPGVGGLLNATFGNAAELIIALFALRAGLVNVVKASITGSILGNVLLVLGASFLAGGLRYPRQSFNSTAAGMSATLLALSAIGLLIPAVFHFHLELFHEHANEQELSLEISIVLFVVYVLMLLFSLRTHRYLYESAEADAADAGGAAAHAGESHWSLPRALSVLLAATVGVAVLSELLVGAIEEARRVLGLTETFVGVIVVAIVGNAAEHSTAVVSAYKNQMDLSIQIAIGSAIQIALFVAPVLIFMGYLPGFAHLTLQFTMLEVVAVLVSAMVVGMVAFDGHSNWFEGVLLLAVYGILAIAFFHIPEANHAVGL
jgi:Ca2+:H+ antiporter